MRTRSALTVLGAAALLTGCDLTPSPQPPVFIEGRAVAAAGDTLYAVALADTGGVLRMGPRGGNRDTFGLAALASPVEVQWVAGSWYVSDIVDGAPAVRVFDAAGGLQRTIPLGAHTNLRHQFGALTDGRIVVEAPDGRLVAVGPGDDSVSTFAATDQSPRPSLLLAAEDGVVHGVPDQAITLYNRFGRIRWRIEWPWVETAHVTDLAADARGRIHILSGVANEGTFIVYTMDAVSGEVVRWSEAEPRPTFVVDTWGATTLDESGRWSVRR